MGRFRWVVLLAAAWAGWMVSCGDGGTPIEGEPPDAAGNTTAPGSLPGDGTGSGPVTGGDGGPDAGRPDGGEGFPLPSVEGWQFLGIGEGGPREVLGVSADRGGNVWVAGGVEGLFLLRPGASRFERFTEANGLDAYPSVESAPSRLFRVIAVAGGEPGEVFVGYEGVPGCEDNLFREGQVAWSYKSGDADRVQLDGAEVRVQHYDIASPPNPAASDPTYRTKGREKICTVYRLAYDRRTQTVWFGANHGVALADTVTGQVIEHTHPSIAAYQSETSNYQTLFTGDFWGLALTPEGDAWIGGSNRTALFRWGTGGKRFWDSDAWVETRSNQLDLWPDAEPTGSRPSTRTEDTVSSLAVMADGSVYAGSFRWGLARIAPSGQVTYVCDRRSNPTCAGTGLVDQSISALLRDPWDDSLWVAHGYGGLTRLGAGGPTSYDGRLFGGDLISRPIRDLQADPSAAGRRILVGFQSGAVGIYTGR